MEVRKKGLLSRGIFSRRRTRATTESQPVDLSQLLAGDNAEYLIECADVLLRYMLPRLTKHGLDKRDFTQSVITLENTPAGYSYTLGACTALVSSDIVLSKEIVEVAIGSASAYDLLSNGDGNKATFIMTI